MERTVKSALLASLLLGAVGAGAQTSGVVSGTSRYLDMWTRGANVQVVRDEEGPLVTSAFVDDAGGRFQVEGLEPGTYLLRVLWARITYAQRVVTVADNETAHVDVVAGRSCAASEQNFGSFSNSEMAEIVRILMVMHLEMAQHVAASSLTPFAVTSIPLVFDDDMPRAWLDRVRNLPLEPMTRRQVRRLAEQMTPIKYVQLSEVRPTRNCARIKITDGIELDAAGRARPGLIGSSSLIYQFNRRGSRWEFDLVGIEEV